MWIDVRARTRGQGCAGAGRWTRETHSERGKEEEEGAGAKMERDRENESAWRGRQGGIYVVGKQRGAVPADHARSGERQTQLLGNLDSDYFQYIFIGVWAY